MSNNFIILLQTQGVLHKYYYVNYNNIRLMYNSVAVSTYIKIASILTTCGTKCTVVTDGRLQRREWWTNILIFLRRCQPSHPPS